MRGLTVRPELFFRTVARVPDNDGILLLKRCLVLNGIPRFPIPEAGPIPVMLDERQASHHITSSVHGINEPVEALLMYKALHLDNSVATYWCFDVFSEGRKLVVKTEGRVIEIADIKLVFQSKLFLSNACYVRLHDLVINVF
jgi:hypothetical protein